MGVHGLWKLIDPCGKPVPLETLENQILGVDISIWIHQAIKGFRDAHGNTLTNAHLLGIFHRLCKLLFYKIKPIVVFDGQIPQLKIDTIAARNRQRSKYLSEAEKIKQHLLKNIVKNHAVNTLINDEEKLPKKKSSIIDKKSEKDDLFYLPIFSEESNRTVFENDSDYSDYDNYDDNDDGNVEKYSHEQNLDLLKQWNIDTIYEKNEQFKQLPIEVRHEILTEVKATRKQSSWNKLHELPTESPNFSQFQMKRLLKRQKIHENLQDIQNQFSGKNYTLNELEIILKEEGVLIPDKISNSARIDSNENIGYIFVKDVQKAIEDAKLSQLSKESALTQAKDSLSISQESSYEESKPSTSNNKNYNQTNSILGDKWISENENADMDKDLQKAIRLSLGQSISSDEEDKNESIFSSSQSSLSSSLSKAKNFMMEYSGLTINEISKIINENDSKVEQNQNLETKIHSSDETDTDDFIDVTMDTDLSHESNQDSLEIIVTKDVNFDIQNDIFADIFSSNKLHKTKATDSNDDNSIKQNQKELNISIDKEKSVNNVNDLKSVIPSEKSQDQLIIITEDLCNKESVEEKSTVNSFETNEIDFEALYKIQSALEKDRDTLLSQRATNERFASNITDVMIDDVKQLLKLFGIPFIDAESEAEAQCAFLENKGISHGTITDDSDIWLFGGKKVYKNFFNQSKQVLHFSCDDIEKGFKLSRHQLILLALLVGSDYTIGINGIGPVTGLEILANFFRSIDHQTLDEKNLINVLSGFQKWFLNKKDVSKGDLRTKLKNAKLPNSFPNIHVIRAYLEPDVKKHLNDLEWSKPDFEKLREFTKIKFGWDSTKSEQILKPVLKKIDDKLCQKTIHDYFQVSEKRSSRSFSEQLSKRVKTAISKLNSDQSQSSNSRNTIPQSALKARLKAIETLKKSRKTKRSKKTKKVVKTTIDLSESSSDPGNY